MNTVQGTAVLWTIALSILLVPDDGGRDSLQHEFHIDKTYRTVVTSLHYCIQLQGNIKKFLVILTRSRPFEMEYGVYSELAWQ
jgi:hypothetical protein